MPLTFNQIQPYRVWYEYLQTCLKDEILKNKVDKNYYKDWNLNLINSKYKLKRKKKGEKKYRLINYPFNIWIKEHRHLFEKKNNEIKIFNGKETSDTILVQIPIHFNVQRVQKEIGKVLKDKISKDTSKFNIQTKRRYLQLQIMTLDHFRWSWEFKKKGKYTLEEVWEQVDKKQKTRQEKIKKRVEEYKKTGKGIKQRLVSAYGGTKEDKNKAILISRNIKKANRILENVCKGIFPGEYSDH
jgi:hypothetical protein